MADILMVLTGTDRLTTTDGADHPTGYWAEEFTAPYRAFTDAGHRVTVATPGGVVPTPDPASLSPDVNGGVAGAAAVAAVLDAAAELRRPLALADVDPSRYAAVFYVGGHGPVQDLARDTDSARLPRSVMDAGTALGVVCHGVAALLPARTEDGGWLFDDYPLTAFSTVEEKQAGLAAGSPGCSRSGSRRRGPATRRRSPGHRTWSSTATSTPARTRPPPLHWPRLFSRPSADVPPGSAGPLRQRAALLQASARCHAPVGAPANSRPMAASTDGCTR
ncbi:Putative intracellular protease/amidase [Streptomyces sp. di188]|nr:Putative intracellular protease/amidase [Streptomyces sp. di50b]SCE51081.1 Putative intracellular protease/amidase [Streptomyces sp. di188]